MGAKAGDSLHARCVSHGVWQCPLAARQGLIQLIRTAGGRRLAVGPGTCIRQTGCSTVSDSCAAPMSSTSLRHGDITTVAVTVISTAKPCNLEGSQRLKGTLHRGDTHRTQSTAKHCRLPAHTLDLSPYLRAGSCCHVSLSPQTKIYAECAIQRPWLQAARAHHV